MTCKTSRRLAREAASTHLASGRRFAYAAAAALALTLGLPTASAQTMPAPNRGRPKPAARPGPAPARPAAPAAAPGAGGELSGDEVGGLGHNSCRKQPRGAKFRITLPKEAELQDLVNWMMSISCQKFILDLKARSSKVTILSPEAVTIDEAYAAFYAALQTMGLTVEPSGKYFKIVETADVKGRTLPVYGPGSRAPNNDRYVTQLYRAKGDPKDVAELLNKLKTKQGSVDTIDDLIIFTDTGASVQRLLKIVKQIDESDTTLEKIFFFQLQYADPEETAEMIREIFGEGDAGKGKGKGKKGEEGDPGFSRVIVDDRTGTLIIVSPQADYEVIRRLIERLDVPLAGGGGRIHVVKLKNADPDAVAQVLTQLGQGGGSGGGGGARGGRGGGAAAPAAAAAELFSGEIKVAPDADTRSLVILASQSDFKALKEVIDALDAERKQVYIEVYLLELSINKRLEGGASAHFGAPFPVNVAGTQGDGLGFVTSSPNSQNSLLLSPSILNGLAAGVLGPEVPNSGQLLGVGQDVPAFGVIIQAVQEDTDVNLVAEPHLYTADNQEASIEVGRNVPTQGALAFPGGGGAGGGLVPVQSVQRQDVTLKVKVTPHVNDEATVTLDIEMENNDIESQSPTLGVTTTKRRLKLDKVLGRDGQPLVLGGLVQEVERESASQVPGLGQIPLLGWLFKRKTRQKEKINLMMVLVPHILETPDDARRIHKRRMEERLEFLERESAFKRRDLSTNVNYRKKSGLLATINREAGYMMVEEEQARSAELELQQEQITGELGLSPKIYEEEEEEAKPKPTAKPATKPASRPRPSSAPKPR